MQILWFILHSIYSEASQYTDTARKTVYASFEKVVGYILDEMVVANEI